MTSIDHKLADLVNAIHHAVEIPAYWETVLKEMAVELGATKASMHRHRFASRKWEEHTAGSRLHSIGYDSAAAMAYARRYAVLDPYVQSIREQFRGQCAGTSDDLLSANVLRNTEFYNEYGRPNEIFYVGYAAVEQNERYGSGLAFIRPEDSTQFSRNDVALLNILITPLAQAFRTQRLIEDLSNKNRMLLHSMAQAWVCVVALDSAGRIIDLSPPAQALLDKREGIEAHKGKLRGIRAQDDFRLQAAIRSAIHALDNPRQSQDSPLLLVRPNEKPPLEVTASRIASCSASGALLGLYRPWVLVTINDRTSIPISSEAWLRSRYKLSPALCRFAALFAEGLPLRSIADHMDITLETARSYLKKLLKATGMHRQAELMRSLHNLDAPSATLVPALHSARLRR